MTYAVYVNKLRLSHVESVTMDGTRDVLSLEFLGTGAVDIPSTPQPKRYKVKGEITGQPYHYNEDEWVSADRFIRMLEQARKSSNEFLFVVSNGYKGFCERVILEAFSLDESETAGDYTVDMTLREYKPFGVRTTTIPKLERPGKVPEKQVVTVQGGVYQSIKKATGKVPDVPEVGTVAHFKMYEAQTMKEVTNPATVEQGKQIVVRDERFYLGPEVFAPVNDTLQKSADAINNSINWYGKTVGGGIIKLFKEAAGKIKEGNELYKLNRDFK